jgi:hypothetical protein
MNKVQKPISSQKYSNYTYVSGRYAKNACVFEAVTAVTVKITALWDVELRTLNKYQGFGEIWRLLLQGKRTINAGEKSKI